MLLCYKRSADRHSRARPTRRPRCWGPPPPPHRNKATRCNRVLLRCVVSKRYPAGTTVFFVAKTEGLNTDSNDERKTTAAPARQTPSGRTRPLPTDGDGYDGSVCTETVEKDHQPLTAVSTWHTVVVVNRRTQWNGRIVETPGRPDTGTGGLPVNPSFLHSDRFLCGTPCSAAVDLHTHTPIDIFLCFK